MKKIFHRLFLMVLFLAPIQASEPTLEKQILAVLHFVEQSGCVFIRNGKEYSAKQAAEHMEEKYKFSQLEIETLEDFIRLAATRSLVSGLPYRVRLKDLTELECGVWLHRAIANKEHLKSADIPTR